MQTDLFFQIWLAEIDAPKGYKASVLFEAYQKGYNKEQFNFHYVYLPF